MAHTRPRASTTARRGLRRASSSAGRVGVAVVATVALAAGCQSLVRVVGGPAGADSGGGASGGAGGVQPTGGFGAVGGAAGSVGGGTLSGSS